MFNFCITPGNIYKAKNKENLMSMFGYSPRLNDQWYDTWIPIYYTGNDHVTPGWYMVNTFQVPNQFVYDYETLVENIHRFCNFGTVVYLHAANYCYDSRLRLTDNNINMFELIGNLDDYTVIPKEDVTKYNHEDVLTHIHLYNEHAYSQGGICLVKKNAKKIPYLEIDTLCSQIIEDIIPPYVSMSAINKFEEMQDLVSAAKDSGVSYDKEQVEAIEKVYYTIGKMEKTYTKLRDEFNDTIYGIKEKCEED